MIVKENQIIGSNNNFISIYKHRDSYLICEFKGYTIKSLAHYKDLSEAQKDIEKYNQKILKDVIVYSNFTD
jgi:hypothetical protein